MPFTPFHMGPALVLKAIGARRFSLLIFGGSQVLIDLEPLIRILRGDAMLHGFTHTLAGATVVGLVAAGIGRPLVNYALAWLRPEPTSKFLTWLHGGGRLSWPVALGSAFIGTWSHLLLDGIMHTDMHPFAPVTGRNYLLNAVPVSALHFYCIVSGLMGIGLMGIAFAIGRRRAKLQ